MVRELIVAIFNKPPCLRVANSLLNERLLASPICWAILLTRHVVSLREEGWAGNAAAWEPAAMHAYLKSYKSDSFATAESDGNATRVGGGGVQMAAHVVNAEKRRSLRDDSLGSDDHLRKKAQALNRLLLSAGMAGLQAAALTLQPPRDLSEVGSKRVEARWPAHSTKRARRVVKPASSATSPECGDWSESESVCGSQTTERTGTIESDAAEESEEWTDEWMEEALTSALLRSTPPPPRPPPKQVVTLRPRHVTKQERRIAAARLQKRLKEEERSKLEAEKMERKRRLAIEAQQRKRAADERERKRKLAAEAKERNAASKRAEAVARREEATRKRDAETARKAAKREATLACADRYICLAADGATADGAACSQGLTLKISLQKAMKLKPIKISRALMEQVRIEENLSRVSLTLRGVFRLHAVSLRLRGVSGTPDDAWGLREEDLFGEDDE